MKVIHFITDEKHLNNTIDFFEDIKELENRYILVTYDETPFNYLDSNKIERVPITDIKRIISNPNLCDIIVLHNLSSLPCEYIKVTEHLCPAPQDSCNPQTCYLPTRLPGN